MTWVWIGIAAFIVLTLLGLFGKTCNERDELMLIYTLEAAARLAVEGTEEERSALDDRGDRIFPLSQLCLMAQCVARRPTRGDRTPWYPSLARAMERLESRGVVRSFGHTKAGDCYVALCRPASRRPIYGSNN